MRKFSINNKVITQNTKPYIIAEACINHEGKIKLAKKMVDLASKAQASAIKFQMSSLLGNGRKAISWGSIIARSISAKVDFADPCSPETIMGGYGPCGRRACNNQPTSKTKSQSEATLTTERSFSIDPSFEG